MSKKSLDTKTAQKFIVESRDKGIADQDIYNELSLQYYDKKSIALLITGTVTTENKNKYKIYNNILLGLLGLVILLRILRVLSLTIETGQLWTLLFVLIVPFFTAFFVYEIARYNASIYRLCGIFTILGSLQTITKLDGAADILITLAITGSIAGLSFFLDSEMFPDYSPKKLKKDSNGEYILS
jgi:hypothetical protein